jgi:hypothetical protein
MTTDGEPMAPLIMAVTGNEIDLEVWKPIEGYEDIYEVSNLGRVRSLDREIERGSHLVNIKGGVMSPFTTNSGYLAIVLSDGSSIRKNRRAFYIHRLVATAFVPGRRERDVMHKNGNKRDNVAVNLKWSTHSCTMRHARLLQLGVGRQTVTYEEAQDIRRRAHKGERPSVLAREFGLTATHVCRIKYGKAWATENYTNV